MIGFLGKTAPLQVKQEGLVPRRLACGENMLDARPDIGSNFGPYLVRPAADHPVTLQPRPSVGMRHCRGRVRSGPPQAIHIAKRDVSMTRTTARRLAGQWSGGPRDVWPQGAGAHEFTNLAKAAKEWQTF